MEKFLRTENRFQMLAKSRPDQSKILFAKAQEDAKARRNLYEYLAASAHGLKQGNTPSEKQGG
jgi:pyruvate/2-oxoacid:ferredoxin oxidoreductase beta subunit